MRGTMPDESRNRGDAEAAKAAEALTEATRVLTNAIVAAVPLLREFGKRATQALDASEAALKKLEKRMRGYRRRNTHV